MLQMVLPVQERKAANGFGAQAVVRCSLSAVLLCTFIARIFYGSIFFVVRLRLREISDGKAVSFPFYKDDSPVRLWRSGSGAMLSPSWGMTLRSAGSMRFRWKEKNPLRDLVLAEIAGERAVVPIELVHSKIVCEADFPGDTENMTGDGIVTDNPLLMPVVTVADCVPLYLFDSVSGAFGVVHSGWKGTGIVGEAVSRLKKRYGSEQGNICAAIGAHIRRCCYIVDEARAAFFMREFGSDCCTAVSDGETLCTGAAAAVSGWKNRGGKRYRLSLEQANLTVLERCGIRSENIAVLDECTCCNSLFGSNRRETASGNDSFTVQAAFVKL